MNTATRLTAFPALMTALAFPLAADADVITLSRTNGDTVADARMRLIGGTTPSGSNAFGNTNVGTVVFGDEADDFYYDRIAVAFDLSEIPTGSTVTSATLEFQSVGGAAQTDIHRLTNSFVDTGVTWRFRDGTTEWTNWDTDMEQDYIALATAASTGAATSTTSFDVTSDVALFVAGAAVNHGWVVIGPEDPAATSTSIDVLVQGEGSPRLTIDYTPIPEPASLALLGAGGLMMLSRRRSSRESAPA